MSSGSEEIQVALSILEDLEGAKRTDTIQAIALASIAMSLIAIAKILEDKK